MKINLFKQKTESLNDTPSSKIYVRFFTCRCFTQTDFLSRAIELNENLTGVTIEKYILTIRVDNFVSILNILQTPAIF